MNTQTKLAQFALIFGLVFGVSHARLWAQEPGEDPTGPAGQSLPFDAMDGLGDFGGLGGFVDESTGNELTLSGQLKLERGSREGVLEVRAELETPWHVYALDQEGGPGPAKIVVNSPDEIELIGPFRADREPEVREVEYFEVPLREHYKEVVWTAPVRLADGVNPENVQLDVQFEGQICSDAAGCKPMFGEPIPVTFGGYLDADASGVETSDLQTPADEAARAETQERSLPATSEAGYRADRSFCTIRGQVQPASVSPGGELQLTLEVQCDPTWHIYAYAPQDPQEVAKPTLVVVTEPAGWSAGTVQASSEPTVKQSEDGDPPVAYHSGTVTWTVPIDVPNDAPDGQYELAGLIGYQTCTDASCDRPRAARFTATVTVGTGISDRADSLQFSEASYGRAAQLAAAAAGQEDSAADLAQTPQLPTTGADDVPGTEDGDGQGSEPVAESVSASELQATTGAATEINLAVALAAAFLGGLILNVMPCVLPVIGLKIMAFVQQSGEDRRRVFALNVWYSLGLISVFWVLATIAAVWNVGWGQQFGNEVFAISMAALVFAMGLSFLGVWEIPIPGFVGSGKADQLAQKEGPAGAVFKGAITTILATPCSGPGIAIALGYCTGKPVGFVYLIFTMLGLGMASPYLIIGAFPQLVRFLPKPGMWMETFKQIMGFVLMATVIYLLSFIHWANILPTLTLLVGLAAGLWWIGRVSIAADLQVKLRAWAAGMAFAAVVGMYAFGGTATFGSYRLAGLQSVMEHRLDRFVMLQASNAGDIDQLLESPEITQHVDEIRWVPFSEQRLNRLIEQDRTVMVDFTADWCLTCKALEATVLNTQEVRDSLREKGVVTLLADWTDGDPEISKMLESLANSKQVPVLAIFPAGRPEDRIVLLGGYTKSTVLAKLEEAGPSKVAARGVSVDRATQLAEHRQ